MDCGDGLFNRLKESGGVAVDVFLWTIAIVGAWNALNMIARIYYGVPWHPYAWHVFTGAWAAGLLLI